MTFLEKIQIIERIDQLIRMKATGSPNELAERLNVSKRCVFYILNIMKNMDAPIVYCNNRRSYYYEYKCELNIGFSQARLARGGKNSTSSYLDIVGGSIYESKLFDYVSAI